MSTINYADFEKVDIRLGKIVEVLDFPEARKPSYKLKIDFGEKLGVKWSSSQLMENYSKEGLIGKLVLCVVNFPVKKVANFNSEVLTLGIPDEKENVVLITADKPAPLGRKLY